MTSVSLGEGSLGTPGHLPMGTQKVPGENPLFAALFATLSPDQAIEGDTGARAPLDPIKAPLAKGDGAQDLPVLDLAALNLPADAAPAHILAAVMQAVQSGEMPVEGPISDLNLTGAPEDDATALAGVLNQIGVHLTGHAAPVQTPITVPDGETDTRAEEPTGTDITELLSQQAEPIAALPAQIGRTDPVLASADGGLRAALNSGTAAPTLPVAQMALDQARTPALTAPTVIGADAGDAPLAASPDGPATARVLPVGAPTEASLTSDVITPTAPTAPTAPRAIEGDAKPQTVQIVTPEGPQIIATDAPEGAVPFAAAAPQIVLEPTATTSRAADTRLELPLDLTSPTWADTLIEDIQVQAAEGAEQIDITLTPERLGRLQIQIEMRDGAASVRIITETAEAARLLNDAQGRLSEMMERAGMDLAGHSAGQQGDTRGQRDQTGPAAASLTATRRGDDTDTSDTAPTVAPRRGATGSGVDLLA